MEDSTKATSFRSPTIGQGIVAEAQQSGSPPKRVIIGGKQYYVIKISGEDFETPNLNRAELDKIKKIGNVLLKIHKRYAEANELKDQEIDYIDSTGVKYQSDTKSAPQVPHLLVKASEESEEYLKATDDLEWQKDVLDSSANIRDMDDDDTIQTDKLPRYLQKHLQPNIEKRQNDFSVKDIKEGLLSFTRQKIIETLDIFAKVNNPGNPDNYRKKIVDWANGFDTVETLIEGSNSYLNTHLTAQHVWKTMQTFFQPDRYVFVPVHPRDSFDDDELILLSSEEESSEEESSSVRRMTPKRERSRSNSSVIFTQELTYPSPVSEKRCSPSLTADKQERSASSSEEELSDDESYISLTAYSFDQPVSTKERRNHKRVPFSSRTIQQSSSRQFQSRISRNWWDTPEAKDKEDVYRKLHFLAMQADDHQGVNLRDNKETCRQAAIKIKRFNQKNLTPQELSAVKYVITRREKNSEFSKLVYEERFDAVVEQLESLVRRGISS